MSNSITTTTTDLTNLTASQQQPLNSSSSDHQSDQTSRMGDELELSATYILEHPPKLVSRSSSLSFQNLQNHPQPDLTQMMQSIQPLRPLVEHRPSIDTIDSYVCESKFPVVEPSFVEPSFVESKLLDSTSALLSSFPFGSSRLSNSASFNGPHSYFEQFEPVGLLDHQDANANANRCPTVLLITHENQNMCSSSQDIGFTQFVNYTDHSADLSNAITYHQDGYHHSNLIDSSQLIASSNQHSHPDHIHHSNC